MVPQHGITTDRKTSEKIQFLVENHSSMTRPEMARHLGESPRWVKRQISSLLSSGRVKPKLSMPEKLLTESDWSGEARLRVNELRSRHLKNTDYILKILEAEFGLKMTRSTFQFWVGRLGLAAGRTQAEWLDEYLPQKQLNDLLEKGLRIIDIQTYLQDKYDVKIMDDTILLHIQKLGLLSQKLRYFKSFEDKAEQLSRGVLKDKILDRAGMRTLVKDFGLSKRVLKKKLEKEGLSLLPRSRVWSHNLEVLRKQLTELPGVECDRLHEMLLGWLLGDGHLDPSGRFTITHSIKQMGYFYVKVRMLRHLITTIGTVPRQEANSAFLNSKEQLRLEMYGMSRYVEYLNPDGSKNFKKILFELNPLGLACYYMDDGSWFGKSVMCMHKAMADKVKNQYSFGEISKGYPAVTGIDPDFLLPCMAYKLPKAETVGDFWRDYVPECFSPTFKQDLDLCLLNDFVARDPKYLDDAVNYYHGRGFPYYHVSKDYLEKHWDDLKKFNTEELWKGNILRYTTVGNLLFEHFMDHMVEARHGSYSPLEIFNTTSLLTKSIQFMVGKRLSPIPDLLYKNILYSNKKVTGFACAIAKALVDLYCPGSVVVDPCAGWGGRMLGVLASGKEYHGFESWTKTSYKLKEMVDFIDASEQATIHETSFMPQNAPDSCDCIMTSPPYVDLETYGQTMGMQEWDELMSQILHYADKALVSGGRLILNIPATLCHRLTPKASLKKEPDLYWCSSSRQRNPTEVMFVWRKV